MCVVRRCGEFRVAAGVVDRAWCSANDYGARPRPSWSWIAGVFKPRCPSVAGIEMRRLQRVLPQN